MQQRYMKAFWSERLLPRQAVSETQRDRGVSVTAVVLATVMALFLILPFIALIWRTITLGGDVSADRGSIFTAVTLSLETTAVSAFLIVLLGTPLAYILARRHFPMKRVVTLFVEIPIVMPPVVAGLALLTAFGRRGLVGSVLAAANISITFTWLAVVLAQTFVAAPFYIRAAQTRFAALPRDLEEAARIDGADGWQVFWYVVRPLSARALAAGLVLSWARALGEFGATILFAGNLQGRTQTMPLLIYSALERDLNATYVSALILLGMALLALALTRHLTRLDEKDGDPLAER
ncbi:MAG: molybdate ABC transporter permease subunit [Ardenticatenaceae bacterium]|nr:molybdate ABC transporter permease subunit [Ardenticatenaceae bacterium]